MADFTSLEAALRHAIALAAGVCVALGAMTLGCLLFAFAATGRAGDIARRMPVLVVPGAVGGVYTPGLTEDNVRATARYLAGLATSFAGSRSFQVRFDELETFSSVRFLPRLQSARAQLQKDVDTQNQSRSFFPEPASEQLSQSSPGHFDYSVQGERVVYASGLPMDSHRSELHLQLQWGVASARNRAGVVLESIDVHDLEATAPAPAHS